jgi:hypothetical protein
MCEAHRRLIYRFFEEVVNQGNIAAIEAIYASSFVDRNAFRGQTQGPVGVQRAIAELRAALPDLHVTIIELKAEEGTVTTRELWWGTSVATGIVLTGEVTHIFCIDDDKIVEEWSGGWEWLEQLANHPPFPPEGGMSSSA